MICEVRCFEPSEQAQYRPGRVHSGGGYPALPGNPGLPDRGRRSFCPGLYHRFLDGRIARKRNLVTDFGKFIDPVADKLLVLSTLIMLVHLRMLDAWVVIVILCRELSVDGLRMVAVTQGKVIAASPLGKWKTTCQMVLISVMILLNYSVYQVWPVTVLMGISVALTVISAVDYFVRNASVLAQK